MSALGVSIYPEHSTAEKDKQYLSMAAKYGFTRVFTCLLSVNKSAEEIKADFAQVNQYAQSLGMEVFIDVAPVVFSHLGMSYENLSFFKDIYASGIRLDEGFDGHKEAMMTYNKYGLKIEVNASQPGKYMDNIFSYCPDKTKLYACHNFYPQRYSGLSYDSLVKTSSALQALGVPVAAFVTSQVQGAFGPWPLSEGLSTLEMHRDLPIEAQARHLFATGVIDDIIIANCYAREAEMKALSEVNRVKLTLGIALTKQLTAIEKELLFTYNHCVRGDMSDFMARSTFSRVDYAQHDFPVHDTQDLKRGDIVILNNEYGRYKAEVHIILKDMPNDGRRNVVGQVPANEMHMLDLIEPWRKFTFVEV